MSEQKRRQPKPLLRVYGTQGGELDTIIYENGSAKLVGPENPDADQKPDPLDRLAQLVDDLAVQPPESERRARERWGPLYDLFHHMTEANVSSKSEDARPDGPDPRPDGADPRPDGADPRPDGADPHRSAWRQGPRAERGRYGPTLLMPFLLEAHNDKKMIHAIGQSTERAPIKIDKLVISNVSVSPDRDLWLYNAKTGIDSIMTSSQKIRLFAGQSLTVEPQGWVCPTGKTIEVLLEPADLSKDVGNPAEWVSVFAKVRYELRAPDVPGA